MKKQDWAWWVRRPHADAAFARNRDALWGCEKEFLPRMTIENYILSGIGWSDNTLITGHIVRVPSKDMGWSMRAAALDVVSTRVLTAPPRRASSGGRGLRAAPRRASQF